MDRTRMVKRAISRWLVATLEPSKSGNIDFLDLVDRFNDHSNSELAGLRISNAQLVSYLEELFKAKHDEPTGRIHGVCWRKVEPRVWKPKPTKDPKDQALETRLLAFLNDNNVGMKRGEMGFATSSFAGYRQSWFYGGYFHLKHDRIDHDTAEEFLKKCEMVRYDEDIQSWFVTT